MIHALNPVSASPSLASKLAFAPGPLRLSPAPYSRDRAPNPSRHPLPPSFPAHNVGRNNMGFPNTSSRCKLTADKAGTQCSAAPSRGGEAKALREGMAMEDGATSAQGIATATLSRKLLTVLAADVVGYSRLTEAAEEGTHARLRKLRVDLIDPAVVSYRGKIIRNTGDGFLATFDSAIDAVRCAIEIQRETASSENSEAPDRRILFRIGINVGDIIVEPEDIYGSGVNIAARLEQHASPGGVVISDAVLARVAARIDSPVDDLGPLRLKNISRAVRAYSLVIPNSDRSIVAAKRPRSAKRAKIPSIAVLPFRSEGDDDSDTYFGEGMVEDIIVALSSIRGLLVISRTSSLAFKSNNADIQNVGQSLGIRYVLSGSIRRTTSQLCIVSQLADAHTGSVIWADRYEGGLSNLFDFQARIATRIVWSVAPHVREAELKRALRKRPDSLNAYDLVMQAIDLMYRMNFPDFMKAGSILERAIQIDDGYATAYAYRSLWHIHNIAQGWTNNAADESIEAARLATAAVDRDPADGFALAVHGHIRSFLFREYEVAIGIFDRALAASPSNAMAWSFSSGAFSYKGDGRQGIERAEYGLRLSPVDTQAYYYLNFLALAHYVAGSYDEAVIWARKAVGLNPQLCALLRVLIVSLVANGQVNEARQAGQALLRAQPRFRISDYAMVCPYHAEIGTQFLDRLRVAGLPE
jgi:adenylate cyclase